MSILLFVLACTALGIIFGLAFSLSGQNRSPLGLSHVFPKQFRWYSNLKLALTLTGIFFAVGLLSLVAYYGLPHERWSNELTPLTQKENYVQQTAFTEVVDNDDASLYPGYIAVKKDQFAFDGKTLKVDADRYSIHEKQEADGMIEVHQYYAASYFSDEDTGYDLTAYLDKQGYALPGVDLVGDYLFYTETPRDRTHSAKSYGITTFGQPFFLSAHEPQIFREGFSRLTPGRYGMIIYVPKGVNFLV